MNQTYISIWTCIMEQCSPAQWTYGVCASACVLVIALVLLLLLCALYASAYIHMLVLSTLNKRKYTHERANKLKRKTKMIIIIIIIAQPFVCENINNMRLCILYLLQRTMPIYSISPLFNSLWSYGCDKCQFYDFPFYISKFKCSRSLACHLAWLLGKACRWEASEMWQKILYAFCCRVQSQIRSASFRNQSICSVCCRKNRRECDSSPCLCPS